MITTDELPPEMVEWEIEIRFGKAFRGSTMDIKKRVLKFKAQQILMGSKEGLPIKMTDTNEIQYELSRVRSLHDEVMAGISPQRRMNNTQFTKLILLYGAAYQLKHYETDVVMQDINHTLSQHFNIVLEMAEEQENSGEEIDVMEGIEAVSPPDNTETSAQRETASERPPQASSSQESRRERKIVALKGVIERLESELQSKKDQQLAQELGFKIVNGTAIEVKCHRCKIFGHRVKDCVNRRWRRGPRGRVDEGSTQGMPM